MNRTHILPKHSEICSENLSHWFWGYLQMDGKLCHWIKAYKQWEAIFFTWWSGQFVRNFAFIISMLLSNMSKVGPKARSLSKSIQKMIYALDVTILTWWKTGVTLCNLNCLKWNCVKKNFFCAIHEFSAHFQVTSKINLLSTKTLNRK